jgi:hypothetical protein
MTLEWLMILVCFGIKVFFMMKEKNCLCFRYLGLHSNAQSISHHENPWYALVDVEENEGKTGQCCS